MAVQESSSIGRSVGSFLSGAFLIIGIVVMLGIGYTLWRQQARYSTPAQQTQPTADTSELQRLKAQNAAIQAQLDAVQQSITVQQVPAGQAAQPIQVQQPAAPAPADSAAPAVEPVPAPVVIVQHEGYSQPVITGSGACAVAPRGARRCGDK